MFVNVIDSAEEQFLSHCTCAYPSIFATKCSCASFIYNFSHFRLLKYFYGWLDSALCARFIWTLRQHISRAWIRADTFSTFLLFEFDSSTEQAKILNVASQALWHLWQPLPPDTNTCKTAQVWALPYFSIRCRKVGRCNLRITVIQRNALVLKGARNVLKFAVFPSDRLTALTLYLFMYVCII